MIQLGRDWLMKTSFQRSEQSDVPVYYKYLYENYLKNVSDPINRSLSSIHVVKNGERINLMNSNFLFQDRGLKKKEPCKNWLYPTDTRAGCSNYLWFWA